MTSAHACTHTLAHKIHTRIYAYIYRVADILTFTLPQTCLNKHCISSVSRFQSSCIIIVFVVVTRLLLLQQTCFRPHCNTHVQLCCDYPRISGLLQRTRLTEETELKSADDVTEQLNQSDTCRRNFCTSGILTMNLPPCGQFYDISLSETSCDAARYLDPVPPYGQPWPVPIEASGLSADAQPSEMPPSHYSLNMAPEVEHFGIAHVPQHCAVRHPCAPCIRPRSMTPGVYESHVTCSGQPCMLVPSTQPYGIATDRTPRYPMGSHRPFAMPLDEECCGTQQRVLTLPSFAPQQRVGVDSVPCRTTLASPLWQAAQARHQMAHQYMQQCGVPPDVASFQCGQPDAPRMTTPDECLYVASRQFEMMMKSRDADIPHDESVTAGNYGWPPGGAASARTSYASATPIMQPCDTAINCHMCAALRNQPSEVDGDVEASGISTGTGQSWVTQHLCVADQHGQLLDTTANCRTCLAEQLRSNATVGLPFWTPPKVPSNEICNFPSSELMPNGPFFSISQDVPSCEITCETEPIQKQWLMTSERRSVTAVEGESSNKHIREQTFRTVRHKTTRDLSRSTASRDRNPPETMRDKAMLSALSPNWKLQGQLRSEATGKAVTRDTTPVVVSLKSRSREIRHDSIPVTTTLVRTEMHWDYYIPGLPDNATEDEEGFTSRSRKDPPKPKPKPEPEPKQKTVVIPPPPVRTIEPSRAPTVKPPDNRMALIPAKWTHPTTWSVLLERATRKAIDVVRHVVRMFAPVVKPGLQALPSPERGRTASVDRVPLAPRLGRSALCRRCLRQQLAKTSANLDDPPRLTSSSVLERYYCGEAARVCPLADGLRGRIHMLETAYALATAFPDMSPPPGPVLEKSLSDPVLPLRRACCPRHSAGSAATSGTGSRLQETTSSSANDDASPANTDDDRDWEDASANTYASARQALDDDNDNDGSELSGSHLVSPWHNIEQYSLVFVDATDVVVVPSDGGGGCDGGGEGDVGSLDDVGSLPSTHGRTRSRTRSLTRNRTRSRTRSHNRGRTRTLSSSPTPTDLPSLDSGDSFNRSDFIEDDDDDDDDDIIDSGVVDSECLGVVLGHQGDDETGHYNCKPCDVTKPTCKPEDGVARDND